MSIRQSRIPPQILMTDFKSGEPYLSPRLEIEQSIYRKMLVSTENRYFLPRCLTKKSINSAEELSISTTKFSTLLVK